MSKHSWIEVDRTSSHKLWQDENDLKIWTITGYREYKVYSYLYFDIDAETTCVSNCCDDGIDYVSHNSLIRGFSSEKEMKKLWKKLKQKEKNNE